MKKLILLIIIMSGLLLVGFKLPLFTVGFDYTACSVAGDCSTEYFETKLSYKDYLTWKREGKLPERIIDPRNVVS